MSQPTWRSIPIALTNTATTANAIVPVVLNSTNWDWSIAQSSGNDVIFYDADGATPLNYTWNNAAGSSTYNSGAKTATAQVQIPSLPATSGARTYTIYASYGVSTRGPYATTAVYTQPTVLATATGFCELQCTSSSTSTETDPLSVVWTLTNSPTRGASPLVTPSLAGQGVFTNKPIVCTTASNGTGAYAISGNIAFNSLLPLTIHTVFTTPSSFTTHSNFQFLATLVNQSAAWIGLAAGQLRIVMNDGVAFAETNATLTVSTTYCATFVINKWGIQIWLNGVNQAVTTTNNGQGSYWSGATCKVCLGGDARFATTPTNTDNFAIASFIMDGQTWTPSEIVSAYQCLVQPKVEACRKLVTQTTLWANNSLPSWIGAVSVTELGIAGYNSAGWSNVSMSGFTGNPQWFMLFDAPYSSSNVMGYAVWNGSPLNPTNLTWCANPILGDAYGGFAASLSFVNGFINPDNSIDIYFGSPAFDAGSTVEKHFKTSVLPFASNPSPATVTSLGAGQPATNYEATHVCINQLNGVYYLLADGFSPQYSTGKVTASSLASNTWSTGAIVQSLNSNNPSVGTTASAYEYTSTVNVGGVFYGVLVSSQSFIGFEAMTTTDFNTFTIYSNTNSYTGSTTIAAPVLEWTGLTVQGNPSAIAALGNESMLYYPVGNGGNGETDILYVSGSNDVTPGAGVGICIATWPGTPAQLLADGSFSVSVGAAFTRPPTGSNMSFTQTLTAVSVATGSSYVAGATMTPGNNDINPSFTVYAPPGADVNFQLIGQTSASAPWDVILDGAACNNTGLIGGTPPPFGASYHVAAGTTNSYAMKISAPMANYAIQFKTDSKSTQTVNFDFVI